MHSRPTVVSPPIPIVSVLLQQDRLQEQRARRQRRLLSAAQSARIRRGMIRYVQVVLDLSRAASLSGVRACVQPAGGGSLFTAPLHCSTPRRSYTVRGGAALSTPCTTPPPPHTHTHTSPADMRPVRSVVMAGILRHFVRAFFDENPLSQLGILVLRNGLAERLTDLSSSPVRTTPDTIHPPARLSS